MVSRGLSGGAARGRASSDPAAGTTLALGSFAGAELYLLPVDDRLAVLRPPFARVGMVRIGRSDYVLADSDVPEARLHSRDGNLPALIRWDGADRRITASMLDIESRYRYRHLEDEPALEQRLEEQRRMADHETLPSFGSVHLGGDGRVCHNDLTVRRRPIAGALNSARVARLSATTHVMFATPTPRWNGMVGRWLG